MDTDRSANAAYYIHLFEYDAWANGRVLSLLRANPALESTRCADLLSHLLRSQAIWLGRIQQTDDRWIERWRRDPLDTCARRGEQNTGNWIDLLRSCGPADFTRPVTYMNSQGRTFTTELRDIATHVVNHGTYHRAQIAQLTRSAGVEPVVTDYIAYARE